MSLAKAFALVAALSIPSWDRLLMFLSATFLAYTVSLLIHRIYLSPLADFPGPFLAKATHWYEFYHNFVRTGKYYEEIKKMHDVYGPLVRVTPDEIHVMDPAMYRKIFVTGVVMKTDSYPRFSNGTGFEDMTAISVSHDSHKRLRAPIDRLFARTSIMRIEARVVARTERMYGRLGAYQGTGEVVNLTNALSSLTTDIISSVIFEEPSDYLGATDFNEEWYHTLKMGTLNVPLFKHMPMMVSIVTKPLIRRLVTYVTNWTIWDEKARRQVSLIRKRPSDESKTREETTVLDHLVHSELVEKELGGNGGFARLAQLIQQAGAHNVSHALGTIVTHLLLDPEKLARLRDELEGTWEQARLAGKTDGPSWMDLEKASYLSAVVSEGLRMAIGGMNRTPRVFPDVDLECCGRVIPRGTPISMTTFWMHNDPTAFPNPDRFEPSRWLDADDETLKLMKAYFVPFATGSRVCVGQNLVYMQMFHTLGRLFRPGSPQFALFGTDIRDITAVHGLLFPMPPFDSKGVRVTVL